MGKQLTDYPLYRWRYALGYGLIGLTILVLIIVAGLFIPGGLSSDEMQSVVASSAISLSPSSIHPETIINFPYHLLQHTSISLFGVSNFSIKLPSILLGLLSVGGIFILLRSWFRENIAILTGIIIITTGPFLYVAQSGTPSIVYIFWSVWLLVSALMISRRARFTGVWKVVLCAIAALSIYTPLSIYILIALVSAVILHPHLRYLVRKLSKVKLTVGIIVALVLVSPLVYAIVRQPSVGLTLLGTPTSSPDLKANVLQLLRQYFDFISPSSSIIMTPIYGLGSVILIALGFVQLATTKYTARSYIVSAWIILLIPALLVNPGYISITFIPVLLLMAMGVSLLLTSWYSLFPRNPYARFAGLLPLTVLIGGLVLSGVGRYMYGYTYDPKTSNYFSHDLVLLNKELKAEKGTTLLVTAQKEKPFYTVVAQHHEGLSVIDTTEPITANAAPTIVVTHTAHQTAAAPNLYRIITDTTSNNADRFYIYKTNPK